MDAVVQNEQVEVCSYLYIHSKMVRPLPSPPVTSSRRLAPSLNASTHSRLHPFPFPLLPRPAPQPWKSTRHMDDLSKVAVQAHTRLADAKHAVYTRERSGGAKGPNAVSRRDGEPGWGWCGWEGARAARAEWRTTRWGMEGPKREGWEPGAREGWGGRGKADRETM